MAYLKPLDPEETDQDFTTDYFMLDYGPFGVSGFCMDGKEIGDYCYLCNSQCIGKSQSKKHFEGKRHVAKVKICRKIRTEFVVEPSTGGDLDDPDNLFLPDKCKVCDADLSNPDQQEAHYMSEKHQKKVRHYFLVKVGVKEDRKTDFTCDDTNSAMEYCSLCKIVLSAPVVARAHYAGRKHAKKEREQQEGDMSSQHDKTIWRRCDICDIKVNSDSQFHLHLASLKHIKNAKNQGIDYQEKARKLAAKRKEEIKTQLHVDTAKRVRLAKELEELIKLEKLQC